MKLTTLTREQCQQVRIWRNDEPQFLRTPYLLTKEMQDEFYDEVVCNRDSKHRYFGIMDDIKYSAVEAADNRKCGIYPEDGLYPEFIGMVGLTNIEWENGTAEISLIINPEYRRQGKGKEAVKLLLDEAFKQLRLYSVYGEVYKCGNVDFWKHIIQEYGPTWVEHYTWVQLADRKYYNGKHWDSIWFSFRGCK